jgi:hypothetical protein
MPASNDWTVQYFDGSAWTTINNVQQLTCTVGRQAPLEQWPVSSAQIRVWYPTGYSSPLANFGVGTAIRFSAPGRLSTKPMWTGYVANAVLELGIPWNSGTTTGQADFLNISCEGAGALIGRGEQVSIGSYGLGTAETVKTLIEGINTNASLPVGYDTTDTAFTTRKWDTTVFTALVEYPWTLLQDTAVYGQWRLCDGIRKTWSWAGSAGSTDEPAVYMGASPKVSPPVTSVSFSDTTNDATRRTYEEVTFDGLADVYVTRAALSFTYYGGGSPTTITETKTNGSKPWRSFVANVLPQSLYSLGDGTYIDETAEWYANAFSDQSPTFSSVSATTYGQQTQNLDNLGVTDLEFGMLPRYAVNVTLRGTTYLCQIEGATVTADTEGARYTYYVSPAGDTAYFMLDDTNAGRLDFNRLGFY